MCTMTGINDLLTTTPSIGLHNLNMAHLDSMFPASLEIHDKLELKTSQTGASARCSQFTLTIRLGSPGLSGCLSCHLIQVSSQLCSSLRPSVKDIWLHDHKVDHLSLASGVLYPITLMNHPLLKHFNGQSMTSTEVKLHTTQVHEHLSLQTLSFPGPHPETP